MPRPKGQALLTRERIVAAALDLIDRHGLEALSMRKLGGELGVDPMSIYHHLPNKEALLGAVVHDVFSNMPIPPDKGDWKRRVGAWVAGYRGIALAHPNLVLRIVSDPAAVAVAAVDANESLYAALDSAGLSPLDIARATDVIVDYVNGSVLAAASETHRDVDAAAVFLAELDARPAEQSAVQRRVLADPEVAKGRNSFEFGLELILSALVTRVR